MIRNLSRFIDIMAQPVRATLLAAENRWFMPLFSQMTVTNLTHFGTLAVLAVYLAQNLAFSAADTALMLVAASLGLRGGRLALAPFIDRIAPNKLIPAAILVSIAGYFGLMHAVTPGLVALSVALVGLGYGVNSIVVTTLASYTTQRSANTYPMYALMHTGVNVAAALAPLAYNALRLHLFPQAPFACSALILCASFALSLRIRGDVPHPYRDTRFWQAAGALIKNPRYLGVLGFIAAGWAIYTQKFAATPLFIGTVLDRPEYVGLAVGLNALIGLVVSIPAGSFIRARNIDSRQVLALSFLLYAAGYSLLCLSPTLAGLWCGLLCWSVGEAILMPQLNALVAGYTTHEHRLAGFSLAAAGIGLGEAAGNAIGVALITGAVRIGHPGWCFAVLAIGALIAAAGTGFLSAPRKVARA